ncbi:LysR family transcriptional regulator [Denitratisoma oestradiolicum]|uniref:Putative PCP degradation transcriptional activation protein n=1 Tax=Denitratisoma oestradiolicum TaxID=311182 RepID=A0A6S6XR32_9PROT|nr:LysR family transcriptional regulator [Denitratisoma oestradiolicum]CAB1368456.1 putative PCP degradation transcriptional activation protein [Denitratisoma oestradiolicum]
MKNIDIRRVDLNLLVAFEAIYEEGSVTRASERLHLTQSAISHALSRLRELCDDPLFERNGNIITPTAMARRLIGPVQSALRLLEQSINQAHPAKPEKVRPRLNIGMLLATYGPGFLPQLTASMGNTPPYEIAVSHYSLGKLESHLAAGKFDVAIQFEFPHSSRIRSTLLNCEKLGIMVRQGHPLSKGTMDLDAYLGQYHVVVAPFEQDANLVDLEFQRLGLKREIVLRCQDYWTACKTVAATDFLLTATRSTLALMQESFPGNRLVALPTDLNTPREMNIRLYWHESKEEDPANLWLRNTLCSIFTGYRNSSPD